MKSDPSVSEIVKLKVFAYIISVCYFTNSFIHLISLDSADIMTDNELWLIQMKKTRFIYVSFYEKDLIPAFE